MKTKNKIYPEVELNIVLVHGVLSSGKDFDELAGRFKSDERLKHINTKVSVIKYGKLLLSVGRIPFVRNLVSRYVAARLAACTYKYPNAKTVVLAHSFGTWAVCHAIKELYNEFRVEMLILVGSVVPRNFPLHRYRLLWVVNFVGIRDWVVFISALWGTGWSGLFGFKRTRTVKCDNLTEYHKDWGHNDYHKGYCEYVGLIVDYLGIEGLRR